MTNTEFFELSEREVKLLNGSSSEAAQEAWRAGYNYAREFVKKQMNECFNSEFMDKMAEFSNEELEVFDF